MEQETFASLGKVIATEQLQAIFKENFSNKKKISHHSLLWLEGLHFDLSYFPLKHLGYKCVTALVSELYADFSRPLSLNICLGLSSRFDYPHAKEFCLGVELAAKEHKFQNVKVDLQASSSALLISASAGGEIIEEMEKNRAKTQSKDLICLSDNIAGAYFGFQLLEKYKKAQGNEKAAKELEKYKMMVGSYLRPQLSSNIIEQLLENKIFPSAAVVVSKGLADAVKKLAKISNLGVKIYADKIPFEGNSFELGKEFDIDPISAAMNGGDDFKLLLTIPILELEKFQKVLGTFDIIGHLAQKEVGEVLVTPEGLEMPIKAQGWSENP